MFRGLRLCTILAAEPPHTWIPHQRIFHSERLVLNQAGQDHLAKKVRWVSEKDGDVAGYDFHSFGINGADWLIEVETTNGWERTPFHISRNGLEVAEARREHSRLIRLWNFARDPAAFEIRPPLHAHVSLTATSFQLSSTSTPRNAKM